MINERLYFHNNFQLAKFNFEIVIKASPSENLDTLFRGSGKNCLIKFKLNLKNTKFVFFIFIPVKGFYLVFGLLSNFTELRIFNSLRKEINIIQNFCHYFK